MDKKQIVKDILELDENLDKNKVNELVEELLRLNPTEEIKIDTFFKEILKAKLQRVWKYWKSGNFSKFWKNFMFFLLPVFWIMLFFMFFSIFWEKNFNKKDIIILENNVWTWTQKIEIPEGVPNENIKNDEEIDISVAEKYLKRQEEKIDYDSFVDNFSLENDEQNFKNNFWKVRVSEIWTANYSNWVYSNDNLNYDNPLLYPSKNINTRFEFNRQVLKKEPIWNEEIIQDIKYLDDPNLLLDTKNTHKNIYYYDEIQKKQEIPRIIKVDNLDKTKIEKTSDFEKNCKQKWFNYLKDKFIYFCEYNWEKCFEHDYFNWKCSFLK